MPALSIARANSISTTNYIMRENYKIKKKLEDDMVTKKKKKKKKKIIVKHNTI